MKKTKYFLLPIICAATAFGEQSPNSPQKSADDTAATTVTTTTVIAKQKDTAYGLPAPDKAAITPLKKTDIPASTSVMTTTLPVIGPVTTIPKLPAAPIVSAAPLAHAEVTHTEVGHAEAAHDESVAPLNLGGMDQSALQVNQVSHPEDGIHGFKLRNEPINDLFQYLARQAGKQYFANPDLTAVVNGQMKDGDPVERMQEIAFQYGITLYKKNDTIYAIPSTGIANLPKKQAEFVLRYLRPDRKRITELLTPFLTPGSGSVDFEDKTDTVIVHDNDPAIARVADFLDKVDVQQRQVTIQVRVFRVDTDAENHVGVDWSQSLGATGTSLTATALSTMETVFGYGFVKQVVSGAGIVPGGLLSLTNNNSSQTSGTNSLALGPTTVTAVLRALYTSQNVEEENNPTVVTEDNEEALIEDINKIPIVTTTVDTVTTGTTLASTVRYRIDPDDPFDVGVKLKVRPTILPDNQIRLVVEPSVGSVTGYVAAPQGTGQIGANNYPDVVLSRTKNIATIPNGYTLLFGGFQRVTTTKAGNKVPILGDIPFVNFFFKSRGNTKIRENIVFMITATATDMRAPEVVTAETERLRRSYATTKDENAAEDDRVKLTPDADMIGTIQDELSPIAGTHTAPTKNQISPAYHGPRDPLMTPQEQQQQSLAQSMSTTPSPTPTPKQQHKKRPWEYIVPARPTDQ